MKPYKPLEIAPQLWPAPPADLKRNTETLAEHRRRLVDSGRIPLTPEEEAALFPAEVKP